MAESEIIEKVAKELGISSLLPQVYEDLLQPTSKEVGEQLVTVAKTVKIVLAPVKATVWGYEQIEEYLSAKVSAALAHKDPDKIKSPDPILAGPLIMNMAFAAGEPILREMYANLLAKNMSEDDCDNTHPAYVHTIQQLSPKEAEILTVIGEKYSTGQILATEKWDKGNNIFPEEQTSIYDLYDEWKVSIEDGSCVLDNFLRLKLIGEEITVTLRSPIPDTLHNEECKSYVLTSYGNRFLDACVRTNEASSSPQRQGEDESES